MIRHVHVSTQNMLCQNAQRVADDTIVHIQLPPEDMPVAAIGGETAPEPPVPAVQAARVRVQLSNWYLQPFNVRSPCDCPQCASLMVLCRSRMRRVPRTRMCYISFVLFVLSRSHQQMHYRWHSTNGHLFLRIVGIHEWTPMSDGPRRRSAKCSQIDSSKLPRACLIGPYFFEPASCFLTV